MGEGVSIDDLIKKSWGLESTGNIGAAMQQARRALAAARRSGESQATAMALVTVGRCRFRLGQYAMVQELAREALSLTALPDDEIAPAHAEALMMMGMCACEAHSLAEAEDYFRRTADLAREIGHPLLLLRALHGLGGGVYLPRGQFGLALAADEESCRLARQQNLRDWLSYPLITIAWACQLSGQPARARAALDELEQVIVPNSLTWAYFHYLTANLALDEGTLERAPEWYALARSVAEATGDPGLNIEVRLGMSRYYRLSGDAANAWDWANDALAFANRVGYRHRQGWCLIERGQAAWLKGDSTAAEDDLRAAIEVFASFRANFDLARASLFLAALLHRQSRPEAGAAWLDAARRITAGGYTFLVEMERALAFPLTAAHLNSPDPALANASAALLEHLRRVPPSPLKVVTLGGFEVWQGSRRIEKRALRQRRAGELLALLLFSPSRSLSFDQVAEALWPEKDPGAAQALFHQATSSLRRALEPDLPDKFPSRYLEVEEGQVILYLPRASWLDFEVFEAHCQKDEWEAAIGLYAGEFLPDYLYADWTVAPRQRLARLYQRSLLALAEMKFDAGLFQEALDACRRLLALEPWQEQAVLLGMRACLGLDDLAGARRLYLDLERSLREELGAEPQSELQTLYRSLTTR